MKKIKIKKSFDFKKNKRKEIINLLKTVYSSSLRFKPNPIKTNAANKATNGLPVFNILAGTTSGTGSSGSSGTGSSGGTSS